MIERRPVERIDDGVCMVEIDAGFFSDVFDFGTRQGGADGGTIGVLLGGVLSHRGRERTRCHGVLRIVSERGDREKDQARNERGKESAHRVEPPASSISNWSTAFDVTSKKDRTEFSGNSEEVHYLINMSFNDWVTALEARHLADLTFPEVTRALRALSSAYVERRGQIRHGTALSGTGKRAAFALFYAPLHFLVVRHIVTSIEGSSTLPGTLLDLGCGTGAAGAAWASCASTLPSVVGVDLNKWTLEEAVRTYRAFGLACRTRMCAIEKADFPRTPSAIVAAYVLNELADPERERVIAKLITRASSGDRVLMVEPLARAVSPWWNDCAARVRAAGGREDEWRVRADLPAIVKKLDRAAGLRHEELTARSLFL